MEGDDGRAPDGRGSGPGRVRIIAFRAIVVLVSAALVIGLFPALKGLVINWLPTPAFLAVRTDLDPDDVVHRLHSTVVAVTFAGMVLGVLVQLYRPRERLAPLLMALAVPPAVAVGEILTGAYTVMGTGVPFAILLVIGLLHPGARQLVRPRIASRLMAGLVAVAAVPAVLFAIRQVELYRLDPAGDQDIGHWSIMAGFPVLVAAWGLVGATDRAGWRLTAWVTGAAVVAFGLQSLLFPGVLSGVPWYWAAAVLAWGGAYLMGAEARATRSSAPHAD